MAAANTAKIMKPSINERTRLKASKTSNSKPHRYLSYFHIVCLMINRSINLVFYKTLPTFSWYFAEYFEMNYTLFALTVLNIGALVNLPLAKHYAKVNMRYAISMFELLLAASFLIIYGWQTVVSLLISRLILTFAITAIRAEVNAAIGAFTHGIRRARSMGIIELSFGLSGIGFLIIGYILTEFGYEILFLANGILAVIIGLIMLFIVPSWNMDYNAHNSKSRSRLSSTSTRKNQISAQIKESLTHKRLQLIFISVLLNKIARNAFYYTFSKWLAINYGLSPLQTGYMTLNITIGCLFGNIVIPVIVKYFKLNIHLVCLLSALLQVVSMIIEPVYHVITEEKEEVIPLGAVCFIIFFFFCGCQVWYNNIMDIMIGVTPSPKLLGAVNIILLISGLLGGYIGTMGSTVWYQWGSHVAIAFICAIINAGISCIVGLLWIANRRKKKKIGNATTLEQKEEEQDDGEDDVPKVVSDTSYGAVRIVGGKTTPKGQGSLRHIDEQEMLIDT